MTTTEFLTVRIPQHTCLRCGYQWIGRDPDKLPKRCPVCTSPYWNRPRVLVRKRIRELDRRAAGRPMPLFGGQWQWPLEFPWSFYRLGRGARARLAAQGYKLIQRHAAYVFAVWHPKTPNPPPELLLVETPAPAGWHDPDDKEKPAVLPGLRLRSDPKFRGERAWTRWRTPTGVPYA